MSRHKEEDNDDTGAPLTVWGGRSGKALFQYMRNSQYLVKKQKEGAAGLGFKPRAWSFWTALWQHQPPFHHHPPLIQALAAGSRLPGAFLL